MEELIAIIIEGLIGAFVHFGGTELLHRIRDWISKATKNIGETPAYDEKTATRDETSNMNQILEKERNEYINLCGELENNLQEYMNSIFNALINSVREISEKTGISISIKSLQRDFDAKKKKLKNNISGMVTRRVALGDPELTEILKKKRGPSRSEMLNQYLRKIVREGVNKSEDEFSEVINQAFSWVKGRIDEKIQDREKSESQFLGELNDMRHELTKTEIASREKRFKEEEKKLNDFIRVLSKTAS